MNDIPVKSTLERKPNTGEFIKAQELIDVLSLAGLSTQSRRTYNLLLAAAHSNLSDPHAEHVIPMKELRSSDKSNSRLEEALHQLMSTVIVVRVHGKTGKESIVRAQLLGGNVMDVDERNGIFRYRFDPRLVEVLKASRIYAQLKKNVIWAFQSKYAMALYEVIERRRNMDYVRSETVSLDQFRNLLDVPLGKYKKFAQLNQSVIYPAVAEVNHLCDFTVEILPVKSGRAVTALRLFWSDKTAQEKSLARDELRRSAVGRRERREGNVVRIAQYHTDIRESLSPSSAPALPGLDDDVIF